jgi:hypothetical protein
MLQQPCPNHETPIKHILKDCRLMRRFLSGNPKKGGAKKKDDAGDYDGRP